MSKAGQGPNYAEECMLVSTSAAAATVAEMQDVVFAAKMALLKVLRNRRSASKR